MRSGLSSKHPQTVELPLMLFPFVLKESRQTESNPKDNAVILVKL